MESQQSPDWGLPRVLTAKYRTGNPLENAQFFNLRFDNPALLKPEHIGGSMIVRPIRISYKRAFQMISRLRRQSRELSEKSESPETGNWVTFALNRFFVNHYDLLFVGMQTIVPQ
ncbi:predicted protein [Histoplasma capsulatum H143]|uniref:Uncharacterized protein n=1 Tax=Ajellomyces capsulatus (strain H143) TaxID=544712 RepID=C6H9T9_AJECH|nr:predicted protein [Histoplasma capsulatum H143]